MSTSPLDFQMSLRQVSEGVRRQEKTTKRKQDDRTTQASETRETFAPNNVEKIANKNNTLPFNDKNIIERTKTNTKSKTTLASNISKFPNRIKENYKGNFLDVEVD
ncbi:hypothetical protein COTS27_00784 [Spirochaetota bacterium]|nr:hypothetical protein COTS27_00784 [Spirochaetota bacterium]